jgi:type II secretory pathway component PulF
MIFKYEAKDETGKTVFGTLEAETEQSAASQVRNLGYFPMRFASVGSVGSAVAVMDNRPITATRLTDRTIQPPAGQEFRSAFSDQPYGSWFARTFIYPISTGVSAKDLSIFFREFAAMLQAGVPITRCLQAMGDHNGSGLMGTAIRRIRVRVESGDSLSHSFAEFPYLFTDLQRAMIAAAEDSGGLDLMLKRISEYLENEFQLREMIKRETFSAKINLIGALFLPPIVIWVMHGGGAYFHQVVLPVIQAAVVIIAAYATTKVAMRNVSMAMMWDAVKVYVPGIGPMIRMLALAKFARAFSSLYQAGVLMPRAMTVSARVTGNLYLANSIEKALQSLMNGASLTQSLGMTGVFPPIFLSMVHTGETTGSLDVMLSKIADFYEDEAKTKIHNVVKVIPVILLIVMGIWVGLEAIKALGGYINGINGIMNDNG